ncbi:MAG: ATP-binding protein [Bacteroidales bacterium]|nr:ATP-binding protein [Bacteroidales bacterium]
MRKNIQIGSEVDNLRIIEKFIDEMSIELGLTDEVYGNILVATMEAANNAIIHGNKANPNKKVHVKVEKNVNDLVILIADQGEGFDYINVPDPTAPENLEKINGRGVFLMKSLSDELNFQEEGRIVELKFKV